MLSAFGILLPRPEDWIGGQVVLAVTVRQMASKPEYEYGKHISTTFGAAAECSRNAGASRPSCAGPPDRGRTDGEGVAPATRKVAGVRHTTAQLGAKVVASEGGS